MKKTIFFASTVILFGFAPDVFAQGFVPLAPIPGLTDVATADALRSAGFANFFNNLYKYLIGLAAALAVIMIIWGGLEYSTQDSISKKSDGKQRIYDAIFGLVLVLSPVLVFSIINPSILNLSLNLQPLDTKSGWVDSVDATTAATAAGCVVTDTGPLVKTAECTTENGERDSQNFVANCKGAGGTGRVKWFPRYEGANTLRTYRATCDMTSPGPKEETSGEDSVNPN